MRAFLTALILLAALPVAGQDDQVHRSPSRDAAGLLKVDRTYFELSATTGGDFYFWDRQEFATSRLQVPVESEEVLLSYGSLDGKRTFDIPVESDVQSLVVFSGIQRKDLCVLIRPDGRVVHDGDRDALLQTFQHMLIATLRAPAAGVWRLELTGAGLFCVTAHVKPGASGIALVRFDFVEKGGRPAHEGMFPIKRTPRAGEKLMCNVSLSGRAKGARLVFVTKDGAPIHDCVLGATEEESFAATCVVPTVPFRVAVTGVDANDKPFSRIDRPLRVPADQ